MFEAGLLANKRILITGGGSGLGAAMAARFAELGASLVLCGRRAEVLQETAEQLRSRGSQVDTIVCDVRDPQAVETMLDEIWRSAPLDVLINNAAATFIAQTERMSARAADAILAPTLHGAMYCTLGAGRRWIDGGRAGVVLSILSTSTITGRAFTVPSAMAKSAVLAMTKSLAVEWGPKQIRLVAIAPGAFPTAGATAQLRPNGRAADPAISDQAGYITGEMVVQDGGTHLRSSGAEDLLQWSDQQWAAHRAGRTKS
ncbi:SDR family NAD(P)-dependent oxidoreductase [Rhodopseudomonas sp. BR0C11]|uniref:SDR family NAD(P)-dependent oxidoreductase n=1 Tax=Rhodopseudomonas sp. BR0C11 TaxID=2269370 RepID=UPI0013E03E5C|nr:SDR family NAD(P)-dependent oxidoreductase [Rhodopseudomonas sp. BR0C11]NEV78524.1 SDR family NAD(P)-dependent oxidoreductase [Rhodopseudomonas sp. BR0C11]